MARDVDWTARWWVGVSTGVDGSSITQGWVTWPS